MTSECHSITRRLCAEVFGTTLLLTAVVGSAAMGQQLAPSMPAVGLLASSISTAGALYAALAICIPLSGGHFNPVVTLVIARQRGWAPATVFAYVCAQFSGALLGVASANIMFGGPAWGLAATAHGGWPIAFGESVATAGLVLVVCSSANFEAHRTAAIVAAYVGAAFWFTPTDFANPVATLARMFVAVTPAGIRPRDVPVFVAAQCVGAWVGFVIHACCWRTKTASLAATSSEPATNAPPAEIS